MGDSYYHDESSVNSTIDKLKTDLSNYKDNISNLETLIQTISSSSSWKDELVKTAYIAKAESYLTIYKNAAIVLEGFINYLSGKNTTAGDLERAFSR